MTSDAVQTTYDLFETACVELFNSIGCNLQKHVDGEVFLDKAPLAFIEANSDDMEVVIALRVPFPVLARTYPAQAAENNQPDGKFALGDWISELANQLMGRFKNKLLARGFSITIGLPDIYYNTSEMEIPSEGLKAKSYFFDLDQDNVECSLYLQIFNENLSLAPVDNTNIMGEGEMELF